MFIIYYIDFIIIMIIVLRKLTSLSSKVIFWSDTPDSSWHRIERRTYLPLVEPTNSEGSWKLKEPTMSPRWNHTTAALALKHQLPTASAN